MCLKNKGYIEKAYRQIYIKWEQAESISSKQKQDKDIHFLLPYFI